MSKIQLKNKNSIGTNGVWITWEHQLRNHGLSKAFGYKLVEINYSSKVSRIKRYMFSIIKTVKCIRNEHPDIVVVQNPSIILSLLAVVIKSLFNFFLVIDAHNSGVYPLNGKFAIVNAIAKFLQRKADITIVTNPTVAAYVQKNGGCPCVLPDCLPDVPKCISKKVLDGRINIVFVCSYHDDEPFMEVISSAEKFREDVVLYITGNHKNRFDNIRLPGNIRLTGFIPEAEYWELLNSADIIMDLTTRENCLVCGAYEAVALLKPMILSNTDATKNYFSSGCVYALPTSESIAQSVNLAIKNLSNLQEQVKSLNCGLQTNWNSCFDKCLERIKK